MSELNMDFGDDYCEPGSFAAPGSAVSGSRVPADLSRPRGGGGELLGV